MGICAKQRGSTGLSKLFCCFSNLSKSMQGLPRVEIEECFNPLTPEMLGLLDDDVPFLDDEAFPYDLYESPRLVPNIRKYCLEILLRKRAR